MSPDNLGSPVPLGLAAFALPSILLNVYMILINLGVVPMEALANYGMTTGFWFAGLGLLIAGYLSFRMGITFGGTAYTGFGGFWLSLSFYLLLMRIGAIPQPAHLTDLGVGFAIYFFMWAIFAFCLWIFTFYYSWNLVGVLGAAWILFLCGGLFFLTGFAGFGLISSLAGIILGIIGVWASFSHLYQEHTGQTLPGMGAPPTLGELLSLSKTQEEAMEEAPEERVGEFEEEAEPEEKHEGETEEAGREAEEEAHRMFE